MARWVNKVILIGNLGNDSDIRYTASVSAVVNISLATTDFWSDKETGEQQERTEWHRIVFFSRLAEIVGEYLRKGSKIYIEGRLQTRKWQNQQGQDQYTTEIVVQGFNGVMQMLDGKPQPSQQPAQQPAQQGGGGFHSPPQQAPQQQGGGFGGQPDCDNQR